jgi:hypothetical protein
MTECVQVVIDRESGIDEAVAEIRGVPDSLMKYRQTLIDQVSIAICAVESPGKSSKNLYSGIRGHNSLAVDVPFLVCVLFEVVSPELHQELAGSSLSRRVDHQ